MQSSRVAAANVQLEAPAGFWLRSCRLANRMPRSHIHGDIEVNCLRRGKLRYLIAGRVVEAGAGQAMVFWGGLPHETVAVEGDVEGVWMTLPLSLVAQWKLPHSLLNRLMDGRIILSEIGGDGYLSPQMLDRWLADMESGDADRCDSAQLELQGWFRRLAINLPAPAEPMSGPSHGLGAVGRALEYIHRRYTGKLSLPEIAEAAGMHPKSLVRAFRRLTVHTPWEYVLRMRVAHAQSLLASTDRPILQIALEAGFESPAPFYQSFRRWSNGQTPRQFREHVRQAATIRHPRATAAAG